MEISKRRERRLRKREERLKEIEAKKQQQKTNETHLEHSHSKKHSKIIQFYDVHYKKIMILPIFLFIIALSIVIFHYIQTGDLFPKAVSLTGGITLTISIDNSIDIPALEKYLKDNIQGDVLIRYIKSGGAISGIIIEASDIEDKQLLSLVEQKLGKLDKDRFSIDMSGSTLGESFFKETLFSVLLAFLGMGIVVMLYFKKFIPSITVISCAFADIVFTMAIINILGIKVSTSGIAAMLMLIGYSIDTDILLSTKMIKDTEYSMIERVLNAIKPGWTMTLTTITAAFIGLLIAQSDVFRQIMTIIFIGLIADLIFTWLWNYPVLRWYLEKPKVKEQNVQD